MVCVAAAEESADDDAAELEAVLEAALDELDCEHPASAKTPMASIAAKIAASSLRAWVFILLSPFVELHDDLMVTQLKET